ncbi:riboflavin biosynthesis protein RibD [Pseudoroseomonas rhizosphaerae]|uniref:Riboflavin biosynthesis protein RibD n=1 Tax=Teichococcus rhizosphaerae TaxID=1335062 RepID=A0A2C7A848_9PROT|nr:RibD family protein [Pseudoroseomonas rhizosphaerae]PHK96288.1 riboflavin biosynthesis protein RibD [Pseudoroseomonas rhizosphaerae]
MASAPNTTPIAPPPDPPLPDPDWDALLRQRAAGGAAPEGSPYAALFAPLLAPPTAPDGCIVLGRLAQTLDGRIATASGSSQWIGGAGDITHTHRLRALCDAVVIGAGTVRHDDPRLTTRAVPGPSPVRVVLDTNRRLGTGYGLFAPGGPPTLLVCAEDAGGTATHGAAEVLRAPRAPIGGLDLCALLPMLAARGLRRIFVEGGGLTVSRFLAAGCLDRLHMTVAPVLLGSGIPAFTLPEAARIADGLRFAWAVHPLGEDVLFDIALGRARPAVCAPPEEAAP